MNAQRGRRFPQWMAMTAVSRPSSYRRSGENEMRFLIPFPPVFGPPPPQHRHDRLLRQGGRRAAQTDRSAVAGGEWMIAAVESCLAVRRATGFTLSNTEYLLRSFPGFAADQKQAHIRTATAID
jgi:hypothetical protein